MWEERQTWVNIILNVLLLLISLIPAFSPNLGDGRKKGFWRKFNDRGKVLFYVSVLAVISLITQFFIGDKVKDKSKNQLQIHDSLANIAHQVSLDRNEKRIINNFTMSLAQYGLRQDSISGEIKKAIRDSLVYIPIPEVDICGNDGMKVDSSGDQKFVVNVNICTTRNPASSIFLSGHFAFLVDNVLHVLSFDEKVIIKNDDYMATDAGTGHKFTFNGKMPALTYCLIKGTFRDARGKVHKVRTIHTFESKTRTFGVPNAYTTKMVKDKFMEKGI